MKREFLLLAHNYVPSKHTIYGWYASEKLDGIRCFWDGGISRGIPCTEVPWANVEKHARYQNAQVATGLWTRYGQALQAPGDWLDHLPLVPLDGELTMGRGTFQKTLSCVRSLTPGPSWGQVRYAAFDSPSLDVVFADGRINNVNFKKTFAEIHDWLREHDVEITPARPFHQTVPFLMNTLGGVSVVVQRRIPKARGDAEVFLNNELQRVVAAGGEGLMLRDPNSMWTPGRCHSLLKVKNAQDMEGVVVGYTWGERTDKTSRLIGMMGSLRLRLKSGIEFDLSGFTDDERRMRTLKDAPDCWETAFQYGCLNAGKRVDCASFLNPMFPVGAEVTFTYRELTEDGVPKEARYFRRKAD